MLGDFKIDPERGVVCGRRGKPVGYRDSVGYISVALSVADGRRRVVRRVHQLVWECVNGKIPPGHEINHKNGIKTDNRIVNLEAVDRTANMRHAYDTGLNKAYCEGNGMATLTNDQAKAIRESEAPTIELAATYGVSKASVNRIRAGATWRRLS